MPKNKSNKKTIKSKGLAPIDHFFSKFSKKSILLSLGFAALVSFIMFIAYATYSLGLWGDKYSLTPPPAADNPTLIFNRQQAHQEVKDAFSDIDAQMPFQKYSTGTHDICGQGQNNYKGRTSYSNLCRYKMTSFYGFDGELRTQLTTLRDYLISIQWKSELDGAFLQEDPIDSLLINYYNFQKNNESNPPESRKFSVCDLSMTGVEYFTNELNLYLEIKEKEGCDLSDLDYFQESNGEYLSYPEFYNKLNLAGGLGEILNRHKYLIAIGIEKTYFEEK